MTLSEKHAALFLDLLDRRANGAERMRAISKQDLVAAFEAYGRELTTQLAGLPPSQFTTTAVDTSGRGAVVTTDAYVTTMGIREAVGPALAQQFVADLKEATDYHYPPVDEKLAQLMNEWASTYMKHESKRH